MSQPHRCRILRLGKESVVEFYDDHRCSDHSTRQTARYLDVRRGSLVVEAGCGTGVLSLLAAHRGAARVFATDVDPHAIPLLRAAAVENNLEMQIVAREASLLEGLPTGDTPDLVVAVMPQKPGPEEFSIRFAGGYDGTVLLTALIHSAADRLRPGGRLTLYHHSLAAPVVVERELQRAFRFRAVGERFRAVRIDSYDSLASGMVDHLMNLVDRGLSQAWKSGVHLVWRSRILLAIRR